MDYVADRIADAEAIRRSRQFPYQFLAAYLNAADKVPQKIKRHYTRLPRSLAVTYRSCRVQW